MSRTPTQVWERLRKMHFRGDNPMKLSLDDFMTFLDEVNKQREEKGNAPFTRNDTLVYKGRVVLAITEEVTTEAPEEKEEKEVEKPEKLEKEEESVEEKKPSLPLEDNVDEAAPILRLKK